MLRWARWAVLGRKGSGWCGARRGVAEVVLKELCVVWRGGLAVAFPCGGGRGGGRGQCGCYAGGARMVGAARDSGMPAGPT